MTTALRSAAFNLAYYAWTAVIAIGCVPILLLPRWASWWLSRVWAHGVLFLLKAIVGLDHEIRGLDRLPDGPAIFALKHQSAWETVLLSIQFPRFAGVFKRELLRIPFYGWYMWRAEMIPIDRKSGAKALRSILAKARVAKAEGRPIVVMPEGTRVPVGEKRPYQPGVAALYKDLRLPVVPVALNSGVFWGRQAFIKRPGRIVLEFLDPIEPGLDRKQFMATLEERIETESERLVAEARATYAPDPT